MKPNTYLILAALTLNGCVGGISPNLSESHPANPRAPQSPVAAATPILITGSQGLVLPVSTNETEMQHTQHQQTSASKNAQQPVEHKHGPEQPKEQEEKK